MRFLNFTPQIAGHKSQPNRCPNTSDPESRRNQQIYHRRELHQPFFPVAIAKLEFVFQAHAAAIFPSLNLYQQKKLIAQGMMDLALLSANANQLRYVLDG
jgi:hypothetical protein